MGGVEWGRWEERGGEGKGGSEGDEEGGGTRGSERRTRGGERERESDRDMSGMKTIAGSKEAYRFQEAHLASTLISHAKLQHSRKMISLSCCNQDSLSDSSFSCSTPNPPSSISLLASSP